MVNCKYHHPITLVVGFSAEDDVSIFTQESSLSFECQRHVQLKYFDIRVPIQCQVCFAMFLVGSCFLKSFVKL